MAESTPESNVPPFQTGRLTLHVGGGSVPFEFPDIGDARQQLEALFGGREYPRIELANYSPALIVDVGANIGASAIYFHGLFPSARIVCFEPSPTSFAFLRRNVGFTRQIEIHHVGLSDFEGEAPLYIGRAQLMQNSLFPGAAVRTMHEAAAIREAGAQFGQLGLDPVSILKLDTEGCELPILRSLGERINRMDIIYLEYHSEDDRVAIDGMLAGNFVLARAMAATPHRGSNAYLNRRLAGAFDSARIRPVGHRSNE